MRLLRSLARLTVAVGVLRLLLARGITGRKTADVVIGSYCICEKLPLLYFDHEFDPNSLL